MGKLDDVMILQNTEIRGKKWILQAFHSELRGVHWPISRIIQEFDLLSNDWHLSSGILCKICLNMGHKHYWKSYILLTVVLL